MILVIDSFILLGYKIPRKYLCCLRHVPLNRITSDNPQRVGLSGVNVCSS